MADETRQPSDALREVDRDALQAVFDRHQITDVLVSGPTAFGADEPGNDLDLLFSGPETFSLFTLVDLTDDLETLLGVPVNLVSNHPVNRGWLMDHYRAAAPPRRRSTTFSTASTNSQRMTRAPRPWCHHHRRGRARWTPPRSRLASTPSTCQPSSRHVSGGGPNGTATAGLSAALTMTPTSATLSLSWPCCGNATRTDM